MNLATYPTTSHGFSMTASHVLIVTKKDFTGKHNVMLSYAW